MCKGIGYSVSVCGCGVCGCPVWVYVCGCLVWVYVGAPCECMWVPRVSVCGCPVWVYVGVPFECMWVSRVFEWVCLCCLCLSVPMALCLFMLCVCESVRVSNLSSCVSAQCTLGCLKLHLWYTNLLETRPDKVGFNNVCGTSSESSWLSRSVSQSHRQSFH